MYLAIGVEPTKRDRRDVRVVEQRVDRDLVAVDDVEDAVRQPGLARTARAMKLRDARVALGGLEHERVPGGDRHRVHPHRDHDREVERRDPGAHAQRLAERVQVDVGGDLVGELALEQLGDPARVLDDLHPADDLALGVVERLAVLGRDDPRQLVRVLHDQLAEGEHDPRAADDRLVAPARERGLRRLYRGVDVRRLGRAARAAARGRSRVVDRARCAWNRRRSWRRR